MEVDTLKLKRLCADKPRMKKYMQIKNGYSADERVSFSIQINKCFNTTEQVCESEENIAKLMEGIYFTLYIAEKDLILNYPSTYGGSPLIVKDKFF